MASTRKRRAITAEGQALLAGKQAWRAWRREHPEVEVPDLRKLTLSGRDLSSLDLSGADLRDTDLSQSNLRRSRLQGANLTGARARFTRFSDARLTGAVLAQADLRASSLRRADLREADFTKAVMRFTSMAGARVDGAVFRGAEVYGVGAWALRGEPADQRGLLIREKEGAVATTVDDLETAQYLFLLRENSKITDVINTASHRTILLLGRFTGPNAHVLQGLREYLLDRNFVPVVFDFAQPIGRDLTETITGLAHMACFVVADLTGARSVPQELSHIVPFLPSVPVIPLLARGQPIYSMFEHFRRYPWVHEPVEYEDLEHLLSIAEKQIVSAGFHAAMRARGVSGARLPRPAPRTRRR